MRGIYTILYYIATPIILLRLLWRSRHTADYRKRWGERFGFVPVITTKNTIWLHAVSVGETIAATPLINGLISQYPDHTIIVTTTTPTGSKLVTTQFGDQIKHTYSPFDTPSSLSRFLNRVNPCLCIIMETELWPNLYRLCQKRDIPIIVANGRLSEKSSQRYQRISGIIKKIFSACHTLLAQGILDGERYLRLGLDPKKLVISGNIKFDVEIPEADISNGKTIKAAIGDRLVWIAASTHEGEESTILRAFKQIRKKIPTLLLILVPRHVDRFSKVTQLCKDLGWETIRRSEKASYKPSTDILLVDTIGELQMIYAAADIAFVGGSLVPVGGHNVIEPAALGLPILTGPHLHNFTDISRLLKNAGVMQITTDSTSIAEAIIALAEAQDLREKIGKCAIDTIAANRGALKIHFEQIAKCLSGKTPS